MIHIFYTGSFFTSSVLSGLFPYLIRTRSPYVSSPEISVLVFRGVTFSSPRSFLMVDIHVDQGLPKPLGPDSSYSIILVTCSSARPMTWLYHVKWISLSFSDIDSTLELPLIYSFGTLSRSEMPANHLSIGISFTCAFKISQYSKQHK